MDATRSVPPAGQRESGACGSMRWLMARHPGPDVSLVLPANRARGRVFNGNTW
jgi:hypothetical protein